MPPSLTDVPPEGAEELVDALDGARPALVIGGVDTGKTTLVRHLAKAWSSRGLRVALLCADPGQPLIGLPGTLSLSLLSGESDVAQPARTAFVGGVSPQRCEQDLLLSFARLLRESDRLAPDRVLIDTCGTIHRPSGVWLKQRQVEISAPVRVLALQRWEELEPILLPFRSRADVSIRRLNPPPQVRRKTAAQRRLSRQERFAACFAGARRRTLRWTSVPIRDLPVGLGKPVAPEFLKGISEGLGISLSAAERSEDCAVVVTRGAVSQDALLRLKDSFGVRAIAHVACEDMEGRLAAFQDSEGWVAGLGILCEMAPERQEVAYWTSLPEGQCVAAIQVGSLALDPSGRELGVRSRLPVMYV